MENISVSGNSCDDNEDKENENVKSGHENFRVQTEADEEKLPQRSTHEDEGTAKNSDVEPKKCKRSRKGQCNNGHIGNCKVAQTKKFWKFSRNHVIREVKERQENVKQERIEEESAEVEKVRVTMRELNEKMAVLKNQCLSQQEMIKTLKVKYAEEEQVLLEENNKLKLIYEQRASSRTRRENNPTTFDTITSRTSIL